ncbi:response regulator transcription factor [Lentzea sp. NBRC 102530]|uniref:response regulator transcription factor n=1 Tax=Lentzea sp. NBRC 102530 TaxID=3032201 RepID=UPI0024A28A2E|nr:response regulator transcription factor [Lentzea sp. NBRC 102530]GLY46801.1 DNA-binding response regulator [Lentzea sp. NBRC 102530]
MRVLLVDHDRTSTEQVVPALTGRGFTVTWSPSRYGVLDLLARHDVVLLGSGVRDVAGADLCRRIRNASIVPIVVASACGAVSDWIAAFQHGADDHVLKPYDVDDLISRLQAVRLRPARPAASAFDPVIVIGDVRIDLVLNEVRVGGDLIPLPRLQFQVLVMVARARGVICPRDRLLARLWHGRRGPAEHRALDVHVSVLRKRLGRPELLETVRGVGFRLNAPAREGSPAHRTPSPGGAP